MNKLFLGTLALLSSNFAFAEDGLGGTTSVGDALWDIFMKAPAGFVLFLIIAYFYSKISSK